MAAATAAYAQSATTTEALIYDDANGCSEFYVRCTSATPVLINVPGLHAAGEYVQIVQNAEQRFTLGNLGIRKVSAKGNGGTATIDWGVTKKTLAV